ncbi:hypothetical protein LR48_Vigan07g028500 [Vigna angularis]|uniref:Secreted protein n=1 Tax=Phaseolus angularis TaxID=3914 RepID=A0A0L9UV32_PHAAN|nr:hypothetical protein LR48_Vigan07g028500 [Vigna angularis]
MTATSSLCLYVLLLPLHVPALCILSSFPAPHTTFSYSQLNQSLCINRNLPFPCVFLHVPAAVLSVPAPCCILQHSAGLIPTLQPLTAFSLFLLERPTLLLHGTLSLHTKTPFILFGSMPKKN